MLPNFTCVLSVTVMIPEGRGLYMVTCSVGEWTESGMYQIKIRLLHSACIYYKVGLEHQCTEGPDLLKSLWSEVISFLEPLELKPFVSVYMYYEFQIIIPSVLLYTHCYLPCLRSPQYREFGRKWVADVYMHWYKSKSFKIRGIG